VPALSPARADLALQVIEVLLGVGFALRQHIDAEMSRLGLTPATARALHVLDPQHPLPARDLAEQLACDRSNVTGLVDRLEEAGLVERRVDPADRRVKTLVVTAAGQRMQGEMRRLMAECSASLAELSDAELRTLHEVLAKVAITSH
jgi:DNA-binding MarR family transcriptional regulator